MPIKGRTAIVTGGAGALGGAIVRAFLEEGANVGVPVRGDTAGLTAPVFVKHADVSAEADAAAFVRAVRERFGGVHYLINAAGGYRGGKTIDQVDLDEWESMMAMNLRSMFLMSRAALPLMRSGGTGRIVSISALPAVKPGAKRGPYAVAKQGINTLTEIMADEVKGTGITVNAIAPSIIATEANRASMPDADVSKWVPPEEIAGLVLYLCSDHARSINGNVIRIFGGV
jgi:NAD(P)-dependent dehydrogenase (short-subunit alcohol dehydrogenase family)